MTHEQRDALQELYIDELLEGRSTKELLEIARAYIHLDLDSLMSNDLFDRIQNVAPHILESDRAKYILTEYTE
jgi:hypothetical protein